MPITIREAERLSAGAGDIMKNFKTNDESLASNDLLYIALIEKVLDLAADECRGLQMFPTMPVSAEYRKGYNDGVCEAAEDILKLDCREILADIKEDV